ncbi:MAG: hypothetical protein LUM44_17815 [Pyrinomonadaceae bacterium]|nr:hypothetical protein [Pyrinomonadaceae bacterium]
MIFDYQRTDETASDLPKSSTVSGKSKAETVFNGLNGFRVRLVNAAFLAMKTRLARQLQD